MNDLIPASEAGSQTFCTFRAQQRLYGIEVAYVREVSTQVVVTPVPQAPPIVRGLANLRSRIFLVLDLRALLGLPVTDCTSESRLIVLQSRVAEHVGLLVDRVGEIIRVLPEQIEVNLRGVTDAIQPAERSQSALVIGVCKLENELMMILDPARLIEATDRAIS